MHIWGEDSAQVGGTRRKRRRSAKQPRPRRHPFAASPDILKETVGDLLGGLLKGVGHSDALTLCLPSDDLGPLPCPGLAHDRLSASPENKRLVFWEVPGLGFLPSDGLDILLDLPAWPSHGVAVGDSLRYWAAVSGLSLEILAKQRFVPAVEDEGEGHLRALWRPMLDHGDMPQRLRMLAGAMPPVCRAFGDGCQACADPVSLVSSFLAATVDAAARRALSNHTDILDAAGWRRRGRKTLGRRWLQSLACDNPYFSATPKQVGAFLDDMHSWLEQLRPADSEAPLRTCFRLEEPDSDTEDGPCASSQAGLWRVGFHLQAIEDRSLLVDAETIWRRRSGVLTFLEKRFENPQERLLADLGRALRLFPPLEESLHSPRPVACWLSNEQAYRFLREWAPLLEQSGFGVLVPPWWQRPSAKPGLILRVRQANDITSQSMGLMGIDHLVHFDWEIALGEERLSAEEFRELAGLKVPLVQVRGQWVELRSEEVAAALQLLKNRAGEMSLIEAMRLGLGGQLAEVGLPIVGIEGKGRVAEILKGLPEGVAAQEVPVPSSFNGSLRPYQRRGLSWLEFLSGLGLGACLADDMGLGKTIQVIALLLRERRGRKRRVPTLIVAPTSVVGNWERELKRFAPSLKVMTHHGPQRSTGEAFGRQAKKHDVVLTSYALTHRDRECLSRESWQRVVLDEAQNIKNPSAKQSQATRSIEAGHRVALTGTPVENRLSDLWSIMEFLNPGYLRSAREFRRSYAIPIEKYRDAERSATLRRMVQPFILRRLKTDPAIVQDLPQKMETKLFCTLTTEQASLYQAVVDDMLARIEAAEEGIERKGLVLSTLMKLKQVCNHPAQFLHDTSPLPGRSGKLVRLHEMLEEVIAGGNRAIVFTQFAEMGGMLREYLESELGRQVLFLHGGVAKKARDDMVERFQSADGGPPVFVLSLKAGGLGLNLTAANYVFHFDRWWNPAVENQATDRAFRIGQSKNVQVYKYLCAGTLEERIDEMIEAKKELAESVVGTGEEWITEMATDQLRRVLALSPGAVADDYEGGT